MKTKAVTQRIAGAITLAPLIKISGNLQANWAVRSIPAASKTRSPRLFGLLEERVRPHTRQQRHVPFQIDRDLAHYDVGRTARAAQRELR